MAESSLTMKTSLTCGVMTVWRQNAVEILLRINDLHDAYWQQQATNTQRHTHTHTFCPWSIAKRINQMSQLPKSNWWRRETLVPSAGDGFEPNVWSSDVWLPGFHSTMRFSHDCTKQKQKHVTFTQWQKALNYKKAQLSLTNLRDACEKFARCT